MGSYPNLTVIFSIMLALFMVGLFATLIIHTQSLSEVVRENIEVHVYLSNQVSSSERNMLEKSLAAKDYLDREDGRPRMMFISKEDAAAKFIEDTGEDFTSFLGTNPLRDAYIVKIKPEMADNAKMRIIRDDLQMMPGVHEATYVENLVDEVNSNMRKVALVMLGFAFILILTVIILINNTIKLALFSQRFLIRSMQLVGAKAGFIQRPFLGRAVLHGFLGGILACILLYLVQEYSYSKIEGLASLQNFDLTLALFGCLIMAGVLLAFFSSYGAVRRYLRMSLDQLY